jgi:hypothetical protein
MSDRKSWHQVYIHHVQAKLATVQHSYSCTVLYSTVVHTSVMPQPAQASSLSGAYGTELSRVDRLVD